MPKFACQDRRSRLHQWIDRYGKAWWIRSAREGRTQDHRLVFYKLVHPMPNRRRYHDHDGDGRQSSKEMSQTDLVLYSLDHSIWHLSIAGTVSKTKARPADSIPEECMAKFVRGDTKICRNTNF